MIQRISMLTGAIMVLELWDENGWRAALAEGLALRAAAEKA